MEQPAQVGHRHHQKRGDIEFIAPYGLMDCVSRIRSTERRVTKEENGGVDTICEPIAPDAYRFTLTRIWRSTKPNRTQTGAMVEVDGYLKSVDDGLKTLVVAKFHVSWLYSLICFAFVVAAIVGGLMSLKQILGFFFIPAGIILLIVYFNQVASDKRALGKALQHALSDDFTG